MLFRKRKCPYCGRIFSPSYITRHLLTCKFASESSDENVSDSDVAATNDELSRERSESIEEEDSDDRNKIIDEEYCSDEEPEIVSDESDDDIESLVQDFLQENDVLNTNDCLNIVLVYVFVISSLCRYLKTDEK